MMVKKEADAIFSSPSARRGRDYDTVAFCVRQGKIAELYLIENHGYTESDKKWHDVVDSDGNYTEVKAYEVRNKDAPFVQRDIKRLRNENWNISKWYMLFKFTYGEYELLEKIQLR